MLHDAYLANLEEARRFEDFVSDIYFDVFKMPIYIYRSRDYQVHKGESRSGHEIKYDRRFRRTGNLFIETAERWNSDVDFRAAGINGKGCYLIIGDYKRFWELPFTFLRGAEGHCEHKEKATSRGFLFPVAKADKWASRIYQAPVEDVETGATVEGEW
jgi:hypothetical protein